MAVFQSCGGVSLNGITGRPWKLFSAFLFPTVMMVLPVMMPQTWRQPSAIYLHGLKSPKLWIKIKLPFLQVLIPWIFVTVTKSWEIKLWNSKINHRNAICMEFCSLRVEWIQLDIQRCILDLIPKSVSNSDIPSPSQKYTAAKLSPKQTSKIDSQRTKVECGRSLQQMIHVSAESDGH